MGTRGACGFRKNDIDKIAYNHSNSDPFYLGVAVIEFCRTTPVEDLHRIFNQIQLVDLNIPPTKAQIEECREWMPSGAWITEQGDWRYLLHKAQGNLSAYKTLRYMVDYAGFLKHSLFCEYAYVVNLDTGELEFWEGYQLQVQEGNRYGTEQDENGCYPCRLVMTFPLTDIPQDAVQLMLNGRRPYEPYTTESLF